MPKSTKPAKDERSNSPELPNSSRLDDSLHLLRELEELSKEPQGFDQGSEFVTIDTSSMLGAAQWNQSVSE